MYSFAELNDFILKHTDAKYFEADAKLYKKHFPNSKLIPELDRAPEFAKRNLDERILFELLNNQDSCIDCIWENRGFIFDGSKLIPINAQAESDEPMSPEMAVFFYELLKTDIQTLKHNELKKFVFGLELDKDCPNHKKETYLKVLGDFIASVPVSKGLSVAAMVTDELKGLNEKVEDLETENEDLKDQIEDHELQKEDLESQLEDAESEKEALKEQTTLAEAAVAELVEAAKKKEDQEQNTPE